MKRWIICLLAALMLTAAAASIAQMEEEPTPTPMPEYLRFGLGDRDVEIRPVKERLAELGYYDGNINYDMDNDAMYALKRFCEDNDIEYSAYGITKSAFFALTSGQVFASIATPSPLPEDVVIYETIPFGAVSEEVLDIQIRLKELGYYDDQPLTPNTYDWGLQAALDVFCRENNIAMTDMEITPSLQKILFSDIDFSRQGKKSGEATSEPVRPEGYRFVMGESSIEIRRLQDRLTELGYYRQEEYGYELNMDTLYAVNLFCYENRLHYSEQGITQETWNMLMGEGELISITPVPTEVPAAAEHAEYEPIEPGAVGDAVSRLQLRLIQLGYAQNSQLNLGVYDEELQHAVELFCSFNHIAYAGTGVSQDIQRAVFSENAAAYSEEQNKLGLIQTVRAFLLGSHQVFGLSVAGYVLALGGVAVLAVFVTLVVLLITSKPKEQAQAPSASASLQGISKQRSEISVHTESQSQLIDFSIRYQGQESKERIRFTEQLKIGRAADCDLVLAGDDMGISRCHCVLRIIGGNTVLSDMSVNGTFVNDRRYHNTECALHSGDRIQIGRHLLVINS